MDSRGQPTSSRTGPSRQLVTLVGAFSHLKSVQWGEVASVFVPLVAVLFLSSAGMRHNGFKQSLKATRYVHFSSDVLPAFAYDAAEGKLVSMTAAIVLRYTAAFCVMAWAIAATIFIIIQRNI